VKLYQRNQEVIRAYKAGLTLRQCAERFGVSMQRIHQIIEKYAPHLMRAPYNGAIRRSE
jgi:DNA-directed RNA polymerase specialized sigma subunit